MLKIKSLPELLEKVKNNKTKRLSLACAEDENSLEAVKLALDSKIAEAILIGKKSQIENILIKLNVSLKKIEIINEPDNFIACQKAVELVKKGTSDILMKGLVNTDLYLKAVLDKQNGLLPSGNVMSHITVVDIPLYKKLLFLTDVAVIPFPDLNQKIKMINYSIQVCNKFGIEVPKVSLLSATEKVNSKFSSTTEAAIISKMSDRKQILPAVIDGPLDLFLSCDPESIIKKGVNTPIEGETDILVFPNIEAGNIFYKGLMLFAKGELAALIQGTTKPVIVTSRSESTMSKLYSIAMGCLMSES